MASAFLEYTEAQRIAELKYIPQRRWVDTSLTPPDYIVSTHRLWGIYFNSAIL